MGSLDRWSEIKTNLVEKILHSGGVASLCNTSYGWKGWTVWITSCNLFRRLCPILQRTLSALQFSSAPLKFKRSVVVSSSLFSSLSKPGISAQALLCTIIWSEWRSDARHDQPQDKYNIATNVAETMWLSSCGRLVFRQSDTLNRSRWVFLKSSEIIATQNLFSIRSDAFFRSIPPFTLPLLSVCLRLLVVFPPLWAFLFRLLKEHRQTQRRRVSGLSSNSEPICLGQSWKSNIFRIWSSSQRSLRHSKLSRVFVVVKQKDFEFKSVQESE